MDYTTYRRPGPRTDGRPGELELRTRWRRRALPTLDGDVLDIGAGEGASADWLPRSARVTFLEPHPAATDRLRRRVERTGARVLQSRAEDVPLPDGCVDAVVCSAVLCSVADQDRVLSEIHRLLRPGGRVVVFEHVAAARSTWVRRAQRFVAPISRLVDRGCDPARDTEASLVRSPLHILELERVTATGPWGVPVPHVIAVLTRRTRDDLSSPWERAS